jgi:hypothetical protein
MALLVDGYAPELFHFPEGRHLNSYPHPQSPLKISPSLIR